ncbi:hypothetical protein Y032_0249g130 [Ancylostoma ceylanicum]|uniref:Uncharacterized protein n=1 Tax=Ancylostoma ceylanicum TaxID=53326 RepID=A0A016SDF6_9BILA|nr:hypothetical protein Y032_0249g130 [Ancylostoma ceylanicum]
MTVVNACARCHDFIDFVNWKLSLLRHSLGSPALQNDDSRSREETRRCTGLTSAARMLPAVMLPPTPMPTATVASDQVLFFAHGEFAGSWILEADVIDFTHVEDIR